MSHYEARLTRDLDQIRLEVELVGRNVERALQQSVQALLHLDKKLANETVLGDLPINRAIRAIDARCHAFVARHLPSAGHLRFISSVLRLNVEIERIGDYAVTISRVTAQQTKPLEDSLRHAFEHMGQVASDTLHQALNAFNERNAGLARGTKKQAAQTEHVFASAFETLVQVGEADSQPMRDLFGLFIVMNRLERVSDQAKNICEETIFWATGESKPPKRYRILFLDNTGDGRLPMALAYARKAFPESGHYAADTTSLDVPDPIFFEQFMDVRGHDIQGGVPASVDWAPLGASDAHVMVSLSGPIEDLVPEIPFHTVALEWDIPAFPGKEASASDKLNAYEAMYKTIAGEVRRLMETLRGEDAP